MTARPARTTVAIVGAGPAGLVLAHVLRRAGVGVTVHERLSRAALEGTARAGVLEHRVVAYLRALGLADRLTAEGERHGRCEISCLGERVEVDYGTLSGGARHWVYPQQSLVRDLVAAYEAAGGEIAFGSPVAEVAADGDGDGGVLLRTAAGARLRADYAVGCEGARGVVAAAFPGGAAGPGRRYPYDWLTVLARIDRPVQRVRYAVHADGFAGMMPRTADVGRFYLEVPPGELPGAWAPERIRAELARRLDLAGADPRPGELLETGVLRMRGQVADRIRHGRLLLAGDAAHTVTPSGAKGLNAAVGDAADLAGALLADLGGEPGALDGYQRRRLDAAWRTQEFSDRLLDLLHLPAGLPPGQRAFALRLRLERIHRIARPGPEAADFARAYAGAGELPLPAVWPPAQRTPVASGTTGR
ncbi:MULTISPECIES: FAD-dependent monooxygenase [Kitasatospora]|uniref:Putative p-hydroxybenzoate hydroxylase n=1 Tax=Kitasatospora setae (strain ATCC 33774 / DSM 43861 / JCM 3304 / KCC A-0304 / NBRC 14216 / KM-6054) TaxID=452652 RepID=E4MZZ9_KITSK|nr:MULTISPECIES: FAD-dependent monooxygenase [Kitasatospora]BAJ31327.1 putative p-hydroxybenzoate hydroxylase [Kitasatospora setae KM-6054]